MHRSLPSLFKGQRSKFSREHAITCAFVGQAFALTPDEAKTAPKGFVMRLSGGPAEYHVYVHRYAALICSLAHVLCCWVWDLGFRVQGSGGARRVPCVCAQVCCSCLHPRSQVRLGWAAGSQATGARCQCTGRLPAAGCGQAVSSRGMAVDCRVHRAGVPRSLHSCPVHSGSADVSVPPCLLTPCGIDYCHTQTGLALIIWQAASSLALAAVWAAASWPPEQHAGLEGGSGSPPPQLNVHHSHRPASSAQPPCSVTTNKEKQLLCACSYLGFAPMAGRAAVLAWEETRTGNHPTHKRPTSLTLLLIAQVSCACSYLGFALMAGRAAVLAWEETRTGNHPTHKRPTSLTLPLIAQVSCACSYLGFALMAGRAAVLAWEETCTGNHPTHKRPTSLTLPLIAQVSCACSYLGFALMAGRAAVLAWEETRTGNHPTHKRPTSLILPLIAQVSCACSYLGFALMAGRAAVLAWEETRTGNHPTHKRPTSLILPLIAQVSCACSYLGFALMAGRAAVLAWEETCTGNHTTHKRPFTHLTIDRSGGVCVQLPGLWPHGGQGGRAGLGGDARSQPLRAHRPQGHL